MQIQIKKLPYKGNGQYNQCRRVKRNGAGKAGFLTAWNKKHKYYDRKINILL